MSVRKVQITPKIKAAGGQVTVKVAQNPAGTGKLIENSSPVVKSGLKAWVEQVLQFVSVGGDFV